MKHLTFALLAAVVSLASPLMAQQNPVVVELYTSQGCSSCPPADAMLLELSDREDVIALALHVDYWDYIGWKDTFAKPDYSLRQRAYARERNDGRVYTPQMVVNGENHLVGSSRSSVERELQSASLPLDIRVTEVDGAIRIDIPDQPGLTKRHTTIRLVTYTSNATVEIQRGENRGENITYHNIVRSMQPIGMWEGKTMTITLPAREIMGKNIDGCVILVQEDGANGPGRILGAAVLPWPTS